VVAGIELGKDVRRRLAVQPEAQRRRAGRPAESEGFDGDDQQPELLAGGPPDSLPACSGHVQVRGLPVQGVHDRIGVVGHQQSEEQDRDAESEHNRHDDVGRMVHGEIERASTNKPTSPALASLTRFRIRPAGSST